jgi:hypothetical protein
MGSSSPYLSPLQSELLDAFFARTRSFFLSGGAALAGFSLRHRETKNLELFATREADTQDGARAVMEAAHAVGARLKVLPESADFLRYALTRGPEMTLIDLVIDRVPQVVADKATFGTIRVDHPREIAANKLRALLDRAEARDLEDLKLLLESGIRLEEALADAQHKHAGADPASLAWALCQTNIGTSVPESAGLSPAEIDDFRKDLVSRFRRLAAPPD